MTTTATIAEAAQMLYDELAANANPATRELPVTTLDYFAGIAPAEPPQWWIKAYGTKTEVPPPACWTEFDRMEREHNATYRTCDGTDEWYKRRAESLDAVRDFRKQNDKPIQAYFDACNRVQEDDAITNACRWRYYWAVQMLKAREGVLS